MTTPWEEGSPDNPICILGEAPASVEMSWKRPLVGPSGDVFNDCIRSAGIARQHCYILNIWPFPVGKNLKDDIVKGDRVLWDHAKGMTSDGLEAAGEQIDKLRSFRGNVIVPMGRPGLSLLAGRVKPIMKWRGSPLWSEEFHKKYIPTVHPAATIHGVYVWRYFIANDMAKAAAEMASPELVLPHRELLISPGLAQVRHFMHDCRSAGRFATDIEVINHQVSCFSLSYRKDLAMTVPMTAKDGTHYWEESDELLIWQWYADIMGDPQIMKVNQNIVGFDGPFLLDRNHIRMRGPIGDTMIAAHILYPHFPKGLDFLASFHTREPYWKDEGKIWKKMDWDWDVFQRYCGKDSATALEIWDILAEEMTEGGYWDTYNMTVEMADALTFMNLRGLAVNRESLEVTKVELEAAIAESQKALDELTKDWGQLNPASPHSCRAYFYEHLGMTPYKNQQGGITTDDKAMTRIFRKGIKGSKEAKLVQEIRGLRKLKGTYVDVQLDSDSRLRCSWNPRGTWTGRLSSSKTIFNTGMNLQNLHPKFKGFIIGG